MIGNLFKSRPVLDEESILWMFDVFGWALRNFDAQVFQQQTVLVTPTKEHFPMGGDSATEMAGNIFDYSKKYAGLERWPFKLAHELEIEAFETPRLIASGAIRGESALPVVAENSELLIIPYSEELLRDPQVLTATYAHNMAHYLGSQVQEPPPGGMENWPHITELLGVFLGFGIFMANTANTTKIRSCASCSGPSVERTNFLSEYDITYALAIFAALKKIEPKEVIKHLKPTLRTYYKNAARDVSGRGDEIKRCLSEMPAP